MMELKPSDANTTGAVFLLWSRIEEATCDNFASNSQQKSVAAMQKHIVFLLDCDQLLIKHFIAVWFGLKALTLAAFSHFKYKKLFLFLFA